MLGVLIIALAATVMLLNTGITTFLNEVDDEARRADPLGQDRRRIDGATVSTRPLPRSTDHHQKREGET